MQATCDPAQPPSQYSGLSLAVFRDLGNSQGWWEGVNYNFTCMNTSTNEVIANLADDTGVCDAAIASITITSERKDDGILFAYPYLRGSIGIIVKAENGNIGGWNWVRPFSTDLWIAIIVTMFLL